MLFAGTVARRLSIHRATTIGPKSSQGQVILKNTFVVKDPAHAATTASINRSQSLLTTNQRIPTLAPARSERARIEALLGDVWSRDILPFPGMTNRSKSEHLVRSSASSVMRKLSVASIASSFGRRPGSLSSLHKASADADTGEGDDESGQAPGKSSVEDTIPEQTPVEGDSEGSDEARLLMIKSERHMKKAAGKGGQDKPSTSTTGTEAPQSQEGVTKRLVWAHDERRGASLSPVSGSAANSLQLNRPQPKQSPTPSEKENYQPDKAAPGRGQMRGRKRERASKVGLKKDVMLSGIRGIFR